MITIQYSIQFYCFQIFKFSNKMFDRINEKTLLNNHLLIELFNHLLVFLSKGSNHSINKKSPTDEIK